MTNADGTTGCHPPGRGFDSRRVHQCGPVAQRLEQVSAARRATFHHPCRHDGKRTAASAAWKGERSSGAMDADMTERHGREPSQVRILPDLHLQGQVRRQEREPFGGKAMSARQIAANAGGTTASPSGIACGVRLPSLHALSGTSGAPGVSPILSPRLGNAWRMQAGLQDRAPGFGREVGRSNRPSPPQGREVAQQPSCRSLSPVRTGECS